MAERPDWALFRSVEGLQQKAGVPATKLRRLVLKELADNALDAGSRIAAGGIDEVSIPLHRAFLLAIAKGARMGGGSDNPNGRESIFTDFTYFSDAAAPMTGS